MRMPVFAVATAMTLAAFQPGPAAADTLAQCISESTGLGGFQIQNRCRVPVRAFFREGGTAGAVGGGSWRTVTLAPNQIRVVSYSGRVYACPIVHEGKEVTFDPKSNSCIFK